MKKSLVFILLILIASCNSRPVTEEKPTYRIGYMICNSKEETLQRFKPLTAYLSRELGADFEAVVIDTFRFIKEVDTLDFTHTNSLLYIIMHRNYGVDILAVEKAGALGSLSQGAIVTLKKSGIKSTKDLKGKTMVFGPMLAPTGYMTQIDLLLKSGIDPEDDLAFYTIPSGSYKHEKVIYGVLFEKYDAGAFPMLDFEKMVEERKIDEDDFIVIAEGEPIPYCNFGVTQRVDDAFAQKFKNVLINIKKDDTVEIDGETVKVLDRAFIDGYEDTTDEDFDVVREMAKRTNMPPYQRY